MNLILCGYKCCGKTTLGKYYGQQFGATFVDTDALILAAVEKKQEKLRSIGAVHHFLGETKFRRLEEKIIRNLEKKPNRIIATGGGVLMNKANVSHLKSLGFLLYLKVDKHILYERIRALPVLPRFIDKNNVNRSVQAYLNSRDAMYESVVDDVFIINNETSKALVLKLHEYRKRYGQ